MPKINYYGTVCGKVRNGNFKLTPDIGSREVILGCSRDLSLKVGQRVRYYDSSSRGQVDYTSSYWPVETTDAPPKNPLAKKLHQIIITKKNEQSPKPNLELIASQQLSE